MDVHDSHALTRVRARAAAGLLACAILAACGDGAGRDDPSTLVVGQALVNLSVVLGLVPTKGIPLPFVSYGGSSLLAMLLATGVLLNISQHAQPED